MACRNGEHKFYSPQGTPRGHQGDCRLDRTLAVYCGRADPRAEAGQGDRVGLHGRYPANRHAGGFHGSFPETGAGGFILPNDRVDVILSKREKNPDRTNSADIVNSQVILSNIRVLAIDQTIEEKNGQKVVVGKTATLELKPKQSEALARARQSGTLSLALRSITDANESGTAPRQEGSSESFVNVFRGDERETYNCKSLCKKVPFGADGT